MRREEVLPLCWERTGIAALTSLRVKETKTGDVAEGYAAD